MKVASISLGKPIFLGRPTADTVRYYYVYILRCKKNIPYIGCTNDLVDRIDRHSKELVTATKDRLPIKLISYAAFQDKYTALNFEKYFKSGSGRAFIKKHGIIGNRDYEK